MFSPICYNIFFHNSFVLFNQLKKNANCLNIGLKKVFFSQLSSWKKIVFGIRDSRLVEPSDEFVINRKQVCQVPRSKTNLMKSVRFSQIPNGNGAIHHSSKGHWSLGRWKTNGANITTCHQHMLRLWRRTDVPNCQVGSKIVQRTMSD